MFDLISRRSRDLAVWISFPDLKGNLHRSRDAGLRTLLDYQRLAMLTAAVRLTKELPGDVIEFGTFQGGSAGILLQNLGSEKTLHVCDSFEGMPDVAPEDNFHRKGDFADTGSGRVRNGLSKLGENFEMHVGFFSETIPEMTKNESLKFSFSHIDADLYESVKESLEFSYPRMQTGGVIIFDDYGAPTCLGAKRAVDEFFEGRLETVVSLTGDQHGCFIGGGDLFEILYAEFPRLKNFPFLQSKIFDRR